ncbi:MAG: hypothetical protein KC619_09920, partial [Myxococcales bacterium]|nr:hypothetical protein [Myxococcales bacterium]
RDALLRAIDQLRREGDRGFLVMGLTALAATEQALGRDPEPILVEALEEGVRSRLPPTWYAGVLVQLAACRIEAGDVADAARLLLAVDPSDLVLPDQQAAHARGIAVIEARIGSDELAAAARDAAALRDDPRTLLSS